jgi:alkylation response protein AidB-like acyl-CoA dehydrogenase
MDLSPNDVQRQIISSVDRILERNGGVKRSLVLIDQGKYDLALHEELAKGGFLDLAIGQGTTMLDAALVVERIAAGAGLIAAGATALVFPALTGTAAPGPVALARSNGAPFRMGQHARAILILDGDRASLLEPKPGDLELVNNDRAGWPLARLKPEALARARGLNTGSGAKLADWWRVSLALEAAGTMRGALATTVRYLKERIQFGKPLGAFQSLQHRLAQMTVQVEGSYWLALEAAFREADPVRATTAAAYATSAASTIFRETQQMHGAIGFTREYPLHAWTMRLPALQRELDGVSAHARALARLR